MAHSNIKEIKTEAQHLLDQENSSLGVIFLEISQKISHIFFQPDGFESLEGHTIFATQKKAKFRGFTYVEPEDARAQREMDRAVAVPVPEPTTRPISQSQELVGYANGYESNLKK